MIEITADFETRSKINLKLSGQSTYAKHPSTSIFCLGYKINDGPSRIWIPERARMPIDLENALHNGATIVAQNAGFERAIFRYTLPRYPLLDEDQRRLLINLPASRYRCTAAKSAASSLPRALENAAKVLELRTQKDMEGSKLIKKYSKPRKPSKNNPKLWWDDPKDLRGIYRYCLIDVESEYELDQALPDLSAYEQKVWELDQKINDRGILIDIPTVKIILSMIHEETGNITRLARKLSGGVLNSVNQHKVLLEWLNKRGARMANLQAQTIRDRLLDDDLSDDVRQMLEYRQGGSKTSTAKYMSMLHAVDDDHRARELLLYGGATPTMRWTGKRIQPQNFPRPTIKDFDSNEAIRIIKSGSIEAIRKKYGKAKVMDVLVCTIRGMIIASRGKELFCADFSSVEARLAFWVAEHDDGLTAFRENKKLYEEMAAETFGLSVKWLCSPEGKASLERFVGKESVLGCQYGMGPPKFLSQCHKKGMKTVDLEIAKKAVYTYRKVHAPVVDFWKKIENGVVQAILNPGNRYRVTKVVVYTHGNWLNIKLPSGRRLRYYKPRVTQKQLAGGRMVPEIRYQTMEKIGWMEVTAWGGIFTNHIVQGIARDLMVNGMMNIEDAGYEFLLSVHDEGLSEKEKGLGSVKEYVTLMTKLPAWAAGAPITADGWTDVRYRK